MDDLAPKENNVSAPDAVTLIPVPLMQLTLIQPAPKYYSAPNKSEWQLSRDAEEAKRQLISNVKTTQQARLNSNIVGKISYG